MRAFVGALLALIISTGIAMADEMKGKLKSVDADKMTLTVTGDDGKEQVISLDKDVKIVGPNGAVQREGLQSKRLKAGAPVTITYEDKGGQKTATEVKLASRHKKSGGD